MNALGKIAFLAYGQDLPNSRDKKRVVARDITIVYDGLFAIHWPLNSVGTFWKHN